MYDHKKIEMEIIAFWESEKIYQKVKEKNKHGEPFYFCDGPPYVTGQIHPGTGWNKIIKDMVCRYKMMCGYNVRAQAGFDTHGLPIEVKVEQEFGIKNKNEIEKRGIDKFVESCKAFATRYINIMSAQFKRLGVWMDFENPYITYKDSYIESSWKTLKMAWEKGLMYEGVYVLPYCYRCETTMANYELEYGDEKDPSIYVKFKSKSNENEYLIIWTTTPWTLVANMAVMAHPTLTYVKVKVDNEIWVLAKDRMDAVLSLTGKTGVVIEELSGKKLEGKRYFHPLQNYIKKEYDRRVVLSDEFVTVEEGTGLVHCAPGHGPEDFIIGKRFDIEPFSPVDEHGRFTNDAGKFAGKNVREANPEIIELLKSEGALLHAERIQHRYPHCWRCKTPLIFLTTKQWFITISKIKERMLEEIEKIEWHPDFAKMRFKEFVSAAPDWCISRQRYWGIPLPIWKCEKDGKIKVIGTKNELPKECELHRPYIDDIELVCECGSKMKRISDVLDVWFDSGNAVWAQLDEDDVKTYGERTDLIIEGQDQIRGWFYSLLGSGIIHYNESPYKRVLMHGFFVDEKGEKMSKSLGNFVPLDDIIEKYGADAFRLWSLSNPVWEELRFNWNELKEASADLLILENLVNFLEQNYYPPGVKLKIAPQSEEDRLLSGWLLSRLHTTLKDFHDNMKTYELHKAVKGLRAFIVEDVSRFYMKIAKERISKKSDGALLLFALYTTLSVSLKMMGPIAPYLSEYLYRRFFKKYEDAESLFFLQIPEASQNAINVALEKRVEIIKEIYSTALTIRQEAKKGLRWPLKKLYVETTSREVADAVDSFKRVLALLVNVKEIVLCEKKPDEKGLCEASFSNGKIYIDITIDEELYEEGITNEVRRRIQALRKKDKLVPEDKIVVYISSEKEFEKILNKHKKRLMDEVGASELFFEADKKAEEYNIDGRIVRIRIKKA
jgi:isoleucyl-tRNA synthetase